MEEIARFLHDHPPFNLLELDQVLAVAEKIQIEYFPANHDILVFHGRPSSYLYIVRRGSVDFLLTDDEGERILDTLGEGEIFGVRSLINKKPPAVTVRTREETLAYLLPAKVFDQLRRDVPVFARFFAPSAVERLNRAIKTHHDSTPELYRLRMSELIQYALIVEPTISVRQAAQQMSEIDASCAVVSSTPLGIISDRDLRNRVVAAGLPDTTPVAQVMSAPILTLPPDSLAFEGLMLMVEHNINHVPIAEEGRIIGVVTHTDILRQQSRSPLLLPRLLERARSSEDLQGYTRQVDDTASALLKEGARVRDIARMIAIAHDALIKRLLKDAEQLLGPPPCDYVWLVLGSEGRYEQLLRTDQDNALVYDDDAPRKAEDYFAALAAHVVEHLVACGFPRCPGDVMATNPQWRQPLAVWKNYFDQWIRSPSEEALLHAAIFFDYRPVHGRLDVESALRPIIEQGQSQRIFLGRLARAALRSSPPLGFFRNFVLERSGASRDLIDLKLRGSSLIVDLARIYALEAGTAETNTLARLRVAANQSSLNSHGASELSAAFELINLFRMRHQYEQMEKGETPGNHVPISWLTRMEQRDLKEALRIIETHQRSVESAFQTERLG